MTVYKVGDKVQLINNKDKCVGTGTIVNINEFREPNLKYAIEADFHAKDLLFTGDKNLKLIEEATKCRIRIK